MSKPVTFHDVTIELGRLRSRRIHNTTALVPEAVAVFTRLLAAHRIGFRVPLPVANLGHLELQWTEERPVAAMATFWARTELVTTSALVSGSDPEEDARVLDALRRILIPVYRPYGIRIADDLLMVPERPLLATVVWGNPRVLSADLSIIADAETCLAAAYFQTRQG